MVNDTLRAVKIVKSVKTCHLVWFITSSYQNVKTQFDKLENLAFPLGCTRHSPMLCNNSEFFVDIIRFCPIVQGLKYRSVGLQKLFMPIINQMI